MVIVSIEKYVMLQKEVLPTLTVCLQGFVCNVCSEAVLDSNVSLVMSYSNVDKLSQVVI